MAAKGKKAEAYLKYKSMGIKRACTQELADEMGVSRQTLYNWKESENWEARYWAETSEERQKYIDEISHLMQEGHKLLEVILQEMLMKYAVLVKSKDYTPTIDDIERVLKMCIDSKHEELEDVANLADSNGVNININFPDDNDEGNGDSV